MRFPTKSVISEASGGHGEPMRDAALADAPRTPATPAPTPAPEVGVVVAARVDAVQQLVAEYMDFVWRSLRRLGVAEADCDDGCQRVWVVLAKKISSIEPEKMRSYIFSVVVRIASEMRRARGRHQHEELDEHTPSLTGLDAEGLLEQKRVRLLLDQVLSSMSWELRVVFVMFELEGSSSPEIAEALGVSRGTVASRLRLAREAFRRSVERLQALPPGMRGVAPGGTAPRAPQESMVQLVGVASKAVS